jgi:hypothetical protein
LEKNFIGISKKIFFAPIRKKVAFLFCKKGAVSRPQIQLAAA